MHMSEKLFYEAKQSNDRRNYLLYIYIHTHTCLLAYKKNYLVVIHIYSLDINTLMVITLVKIIVKY